MSRDALRARFDRLWRRLGAEADSWATVDALLAGYASPQRRYHTVDHLQDCLNQLDGAPPADEARDLAEAALWFHDVVYVPGASDNESRSAELAASALSGGGVSASVGDEVARLIRMTDHLRPAADPTGALVCDVDLSILGRSRAEFDTYEERIRAEYAAVPEPVYRAGRAAILARLLARDPLYRTDHFRARCEAAARRNLRRSLDALAEPGT